MPPEAPVHVQVGAGRLRIAAPTGLDRASLLAEVDIPVAHIVTVEVSERPGDAVKGWREGIGLPHLRMGTWRHDGVEDYVAIRTDIPGIIVTLVDEGYARLIVSAPDPQALADSIIGECETDRDASSK